MTTYVLDDFEGGMRTTGGHNLWDAYTSEGGTGTTSVTTGAKHADTYGLQESLSAGTLYMHFYCNNGSEWAYAKEKILSGTWVEDTINRLGFWVYHPSTMPVAGGNGHNIEFGTYIRATTGDRATQNDGGTHPYHYYNVLPGVWTYVLVDWHPQHLVTGPTTDPGSQEYLTGESGHNYFDTMTRMYYNAPYQAPTGYPAVFYWDDFEFFTDTHANEDVDNIASLEASWNPSTHLLHVGFCRGTQTVDPNTDDVTYTAKYASSDIWTLGFANATAMGTSGEDGQETYVNKKIEATVDLSGWSTVYIAVQKAGSSYFRQIALQLNASAPLAGPSNFRWRPH